MYPFRHLWRHTPKHPCGSAGVLPTRFPRESLTEDMWSWVSGPTVRMSIIRRKICVCVYFRTTACVCMYTYFKICLFAQDLRSLYSLGRETACVCDGQRGHVWACVSRFPWLPLPPQSGEYLCSVSVSHTHPCSYMPCGRGGGRGVSELLCHKVNFSAARQAGP